MSREPDYNVDQEALIVAHRDTRSMTPQDFNQGPVVDFEAARLHRLNALSLFGAVNQREMYYQYHQNRPVVEGDEEKRQAILEGIAKKGATFEEEARTEFYRSIGLYAVVETADEYPGFNLDAFRNDARRQWNVFRARFRGMDRTYNRSDYRRQLLAGWAPSDINREFSQFDRRHDLRPYIAQKEHEKWAGRGRDYPLLDTRQRLIAIQDDPRAGFLPTTNREKNMVMTYLDYLDNPEYPLGVTNQLFEVFVHQQHLDKILWTDSPEEREIKRRRAALRTRSGIEMGIRSLESITYEMGDFLHSSRRALEGLLDLQDFLKTGDTLPSLSIGSEVPLEHVGLRALIQYIHLSQYRDKGVHPLGFSNLLLTREDRIRKESERTKDDTGRNKTVEDIYTSRLPNPRMVRRLGDVANTLTIRQARKAIGPAVDDKSLRLKFFETNLRSVLELAPEDILTVREIAAEVLAEAA